MRSILITTLALIAVLSGCQGGNNSQGTTKTQSYSTAYQQLSYNPELSEHAAAMAGQVKGVDQAVSVVMSKDISIALKVTGFDRFRLQGIKQEVSKRLKKDLKEDYTIHVTTDKKLFRTLETLRGQLATGKESPKKIIKTFEKINRDMHG